LGLADADIVRSTNLVEALGDEAWGHLIRWHDEQLRAQFAAHRGEVVKAIGDGFFVTFRDLRLWPISSERGPTPSSPAPPTGLEPATCCLGGNCQSSVLTVQLGLARSGWAAILGVVPGLLPDHAGVQHPPRTRGGRGHRSCAPPADQTDLQRRRRHRGMSIITSSFSADARPRRPDHATTHCLDLATSGPRGVATSRR